MSSQASTAGIEAPDVIAGAATVPGASSTPSERYKREDGTQTSPAASAPDISE